MLIVNKPKHNSILERNLCVLHASINGKRDPDRQDYSSKL